MAALAVALSGCATTRLASIESSRGTFQAEEDEQELWKTAGTLARKLDERGFVYRDAALDAYLNGIAQRLVGEELKSAGVSPEVRVMRDPLLNAFALPDGKVFIHSGLLARVENEAQLATILAHELVHFTHRHAIKETRNAENLTTFAGVLTGIFAVAGAATGNPSVASMSADLGQSVAGLWGLASVTGYSRDLENEADELGLRSMIAAGYDAREAPKVFEHLKRDLDARGVEEPYFFGTHPRLDERRAHYEQLLAAPGETAPSGSPGVKNADTYLGAIADVLLENAELDLDLGRGETARAAVNRHLAAKPTSPKGHFYLGEVHRRGGSGDASMSAALAAYHAAAEYDPSYADPHREIGLMLLSTRRDAEARQALRRYLELSPNAADAAIVRGYLLRPIP